MEKKKSVKNVAICFSGKVKHLDLCFPYIKKNLLNHLGTYDIFCCAEDDKDLEKLKLLKPLKIEKVKSFDVDRLIKPEIKSIDKQNYKTLIFPESFRFNIRNIYQQLYKINKSFQLLEDHMKKENVSYNYFIRIRFDMLPINTIDPRKFKFKQGEIVVPKIINLKIKDQINDMFCITKDFESFKDYCFLYKNFRQTVQEKVSIKPSFFQGIYFLLEKFYRSFFIYFLKTINKKQIKFLRQILGVILLLPNLFYEDFKERKRCNLERVLFYYLISKNKIIKRKPMDFVIVRAFDDGLLIFG